MRDGERATAGPMRHGGRSPEDDDQPLAESFKPVRMPRPPLAYPNGILDLRLDSAIRRHVSDVLDYCGGQRIWAAQELGVDLSTLWRWIVDPRAREPRLGDVRRSRRKAARQGKVVPMR